ncbi:MAG: Lon protease [candidate division TM6 bacterium GW2011_GWE2_41_16]|nr:MAG: Lon protease [candidate division TM6 bacterium GW2011_GWE2_41_16]
MKTQKNGERHEPLTLPIVPTMDVVVFPRMIIPLLVVDEHIIDGIQRALEEKPPREVLLVASKKSFPPNEEQTIGTDDLYTVGTIATVMRVIQIPNNGIKILVNGVSRARVLNITTERNVLEATVEKIPFEMQPNSVRIDRMINDLRESASRLIEQGGSIGPDFNAILSKMTDPEKIADFILSHITLSVERAQELLEEKSFEIFFEKLHAFFLEEIEHAKSDESIKQNARESMNRSQKEYFLREQLKAIKKELGEDDESDITELWTKSESIKLSSEARKEFEKSLQRLEKMSSDSMEASVLRTYIDWLLALPWGIETEDNLDLAHAQEVLDQDHYGLKEIKDRILDFISVKKLNTDGFAPILCFVGPPGTGKTSLGKSIARCLDRSYFRMALGGVKDESEIRGHRRTYVGAMPGRLIQGMRKAASTNPVIIIDEIDKIGADFKGDPSAALLEVLDPNQNNGFYDNYLGVPFDLSKVLFIATANSLDGICEPLRDRMEIIQLSGYTDEEKCEIAKRHLIKKALFDSGLDGEAIAFKDETLMDIIHNYTREAGVRELERLIRKLGSKAARLMVEKGEHLCCNRDVLENFLGPRRFIDEGCDHKNQIGIANGLAWTMYGGEIIQIEAVTMSGEGRLIITGHLGDVMKESIQAALSYVRAHADEFKIDPLLFTKHDIHVHVPAGAVPKDGPSAGITMLSAILSAYTKRPINGEYAMTGEINLT